MKTQEKLQNAFVTRSEFIAAMTLNPENGFSFELDKQGQNACRLYKHSQGVKTLLDFDGEVLRHHNNAKGDDHVDITVSVEILDKLKLKEPVMKQLESIFQEQLELEAAETARQAKLEQSPKYLKLKAEFEAELAAQEKAAAK